jgi:hypothetical protein
MNDATIKAAARTRRFEAELAEVLGVEFASVHEPASRRRTLPLLVAATALFAALITVALALHRHDAAALLQEPVGYEPPDIASTIPLAQNPADLARFPATQAAIVAFLRSEDADTLAGLSRFPALRSLLLMADGNWGEAALKPLGELPALESLNVSIGGNCPAAHLAALLPAPRLRFLQLSLSRPLRADDVAVLRQLPALTTLTLSEGAIDVATMRELATLPLAGLVLYSVDGCNEQVLVQLRAMHQLRHLELGAMGMAAGPGTAAPDHQGLTVAVAEALAELPLFESLVCRSSAVDPAALAVLPAGLRRLGLLGAPHFGAEVFAAAARFSQLQCLMLDPGDRESRWRGKHDDAEVRAWIGAQVAAAPAREPVWAAQAALLRTLQPRELRYLGPVPPAVQQALAGSTLRSLWLERADGDFELVTQLPDLTELTLDGIGLSREWLQSLTKGKQLRRLHVRWSGGDVEAFRKQLPGVTVTTHGF